MSNNYLKTNKDPRLTKIVANLKMPVARARGAVSPRPRQFDKTMGMCYNVFVDGTRLSTLLIDIFQQIWFSGCPVPINMNGGYHGKQHRNKNALSVYDGNT